MVTGFSSYIFPVEKTGTLAIKNFKIKMEFQLLQFLEFFQHLYCSHPSDFRANLFFAHKKRSRVKIEMNVSVLKFPFSGEKNEGS